MSTLRLPTTKQRILIMGRNGSGKTRAAVWHLSQKDIDKMPWVVLNHKNEELIDSIPGIVIVDDLNFVPKKPGLYAYHPIPDLDDEAVTNLLWKIHAREKCGVYIDEGYMINPRDPALNALYTQGRSKLIPMITLSQRPSRISRFAVSEAEFFQIFQLSDKRDRETVNAFIPYNLDKLMSAEIGEKRLLPEFHSVYYDTSKNQLNIMRPVPSDELILDNFEKKLIPQNRKKFLI
jgi:hypothetical protein